MSVISDDEIPFDEDDEEGVTCNRCGATGLEWVNTGRRWRLFDGDGTPHACGNDHVIDAFGVLPE